MRPAGRRPCPLLANPNVFLFAWAWPQPPLRGLIIPAVIVCHPLSCQGNACTVRTVCCMQFYPTASSGAPSRPRRSSLPPSDAYQLVPDWPKKHKYWLKIILPLPCTVISTLSLHLGNKWTGRPAQWWRPDTQHVSSLVLGPGAISHKKSLASSPQCSAKSTAVLQAFASWAGRLTA
ncbi:hypothetical protein FIBSPDRAFT_430149 [Athelia psychrophila]|uniref:Uncharacterized protein n=1 Tax=Athelia psychrophila TaxID=1759441 RepID=A0A166MLK6_9AGAM|nr:hypothetical protein FIBSPDRAFT_430149 [Fibularhizoctonia sp. CBS 109695]